VTYKWASHHYHLQDMRKVKGRSGQCQKIPNKPQIQNPHMEVNLVWPNKGYLNSGWDIVSVRRYDIRKKSSFTLKLRLSQSLCFWIMWKSLKTISADDMPQTNSIRIPVYQVRIIHMAIYRSPNAYCTFL
jgi:hypothetical protein